MFAPRRLTRPLRRFPLIRSHHALDPASVARSDRPGAILGVLVFDSAGALAVTISRGKTSQHGVVRVYIAKPHRVTALIIELRTRCTDNTRRAIWPGGDIATGNRFRQRASFTARLTGNTLSGSARVTQTFLATGVTSESPRVTFGAGLR